MNDAAAPEGMLGLPKEIYALFVVRLVVSAGAFVGPFLAMMLTMKLGYDDAAAGVFMATLAILSAGGLALGGKLGDTFGRADVLRSLQAVTAVVFLFCAATGFNAATPYLIAFALATLSGTWPVINALVADLALMERRKEAFSLLYWGNNIGFSVGPLVAGFLFNSAPRLLFLGNALALGVAAGVVSLFIRHEKPQKPEGLAGVAGLNGPTGINGSAELDGTTVMSGTQTPEAIAAAAREARLSTWSVLRANPVLILYSLASILTAFVYNQHTFALPIFLKDALGGDAGPKAYGIVMTANGLTVVLLTGIVVFFSRKLPSLAAVALASVFYAVGFGAYGFVAGLPLAIGATIIWTIGEILGATNGNAFIAERAPPAHRSRINSAVSLAHISGNAMAPLVAGPVSRVFGSAAVWPLVAALSLVSAVAYLAIHRLDTRRSAW
ncbi:MAG: MFS transporter [Clostridia bacterium]|jgi:MFS family permease